MVIKIAVITATRAEYGLLKPLIKRIIDDDKLNLDLIVTGAHLASSQGKTIDEIKDDGIEVNHIIPILDDGNDALSISKTMSNAITGMAECFSKDRPDVVVILGDRTEMLGVAAAALNEAIPIAHIHGGEVTAGAVDDCIRHAISKMSYLHFTSTEEYRRRVIQLGESPDRVFNVGALGAENILKQQLFTEAEIRKEIGIPDNAKYVVVTYHPVTLESNLIKNQIEDFCLAMSLRNEFFYVITGANADMGGDRINNTLKNYSARSNGAVFVQSLGMKRYLSAVKYAEFVLGNSSSGIIEAPILGTPTVNIGTRQKGRIMTDSIVCCNEDKESIIEAMDIANRKKHKATSVYGDGNTSTQILEIIKDFLIQGKVDLRKGFYDIKF